MMNGMMFGNEGPIMQGTWYNPHTGDAFTVRDSFFEDNQYVVTTTDGRYLYYNQLQNYVQTDMKLEELKNMKSESNKSNSTREDDLPPEVQNMLESPSNAYDQYLLPEDDVLSNSLGNIADRGILPTTQNTRQLEASGVGYDMNTAIIDKALKNTVKPSFKVVLEWNEYPNKQIEMLNEVMEIPSDEIVDWYLGNIQIDDVVEELKLSIEKRILGEKFNDKKTDKTDTIEVENKPKSKSKSKNKK